MHRAGTNLAGVSLLTLLTLAAAGCVWAGESPTTTAAPATSSTSTSTSTTAAPTTTESTTTTVPADSIRVAPDGSGDAPDLAAALDLVAPGGTILLTAGEHPLSAPLLVAKPVAIRGAGSGETTIVGTEPPYLLHFTGPGMLTLEGLAFRYAGSRAADGLVVEAGAVTLADVEVRGAVREGEAGGSGFRLRGAATGTIQGCSARQNGGDGFTFEGAADAAVADSTAAANGSFGFAWRGQAGGTAANNTAERNGAGGFGVEEEAAPTLTGNQALDNTEGGFLWSGRAAGTAEGNSARANGFSGFIVLGEARPILTANQAEANGDDGFLFKGDSRATVTNNIAARNSWAGFRFLDRASGAVAGNRAEANTDGFWVADQAAPVLIGNTARGHRNESGNGSGLVYSGTAGGEARRNEIYNNDWGIALGAQASPRLEENYVHDNTKNQVANVTFG